MARVACALAGLALHCAAASVKGGGACTTEEDCNMAGWCTKGACVCDYGWAGPTCGLLNLGKTWKCGEGGLCSPLNSSNVIATWGGRPVPGDDGKYHIYSAGFSHQCPLGSWLTNSLVVHGVSDNAHGPFTIHDTALGQTNPISGHWDGLTKHNPTAVKTPEGTYAIFYMGSTAVNTTSEVCKPRGAETAPEAAPASAPGDSNPCDTAHKREGTSLCNQRVGLATSDSPYGPWETQLALGPGQPGEWDDLYVTNPTVYILKNGSAIMVYKARSLEHFDLNDVYTGVATAKHWRGPYTRPHPSKHFVFKTYCEDAGMYYSEAMDVYRLVLHCGCNYLSMWSKDGIDWKQTAPQQPWCSVTYHDGSTETLGRRERPQFYVDPASGHPTMLFNGVQPTKSHDGYVFTMATELLP